jgi:hypothetical protein
MTIQKRDFLLMLKRLQLVDSVHLTASRIISILAEDDTNIRPSGSTNPTDIRLDIEASFIFINQSQQNLISYSDVFPRIFRSTYWLCTCSSRQ